MCAEALSILYINYVGAMSTSSIYYLRITREDYGIHFIECALLYIRKRFNIIKNVLHA